MTQSYIGKYQKMFSVVRRPNFKTSHELLLLVRIFKTLFWWFSYDDPGQGFFSDAAIFLSLYKCVTLTCY